MISYRTSITSAVSVVSVAASSTPADFQDMPYSSHILLPVQFDRSITSHPDYASALEGGFESYFEEKLDRNTDGTGFVFVNHFHTLHEVQLFIVENAFPDLPPHPITPLAWRVGFVVGWLSALALTDRTLALSGLALLHGLAVRLS